jgi:hypothetical protein
VFTVDLRWSDFQFMEPHAFHEPEMRARAIVVCNGHIQFGCFQPN